MKPIKLGSRQVVIVQSLIWLAITAFFMNAFIQRGFEGYFWLVALIFWCLVTFIISPFTFGQASEEGVHYWRVWGWQVLRWEQIEKFEDRFRLSGVIAVLRDTSWWRRRLEFRGNSMLFRQKALDEQRELVDSLNRRCWEARQR
jgi:hypothetical protein